MITTKTVEQEFMDQLIKKLIDKEKEQVQFITSYRLDQMDYAEHVGYIKALRDFKEEAENLVKAFFPST